MDILYLLIPLAILLVIVIILGFMWAVKSGQFDDMEGPAYRILMDDDSPKIRKKEELETDSVKQEDVKKKEP